MPFDTSLADHEIVNRISRLVDYQADPSTPHSHLREAERQLLIAIDEMEWDDDAVQLLDAADVIASVRKEMKNDG